jgi:hypothetical protein
VKLYVASSFRNARYPDLVALLRACGHDVHDWRDHAHRGGKAIEADRLDPQTLAEFRAAVSTERAARTFADHMAALAWCDACVLVLPCGRSAHLEMGYARGLGKRVVVLFDPAREPFGCDLMYRMADRLLADPSDLVPALEELARGDAAARPAYEPPTVECVGRLATSNRYRDGEAVTYTVGPASCPFCTGTFCVTRDAATQRPTVDHSLPQCVPYLSHSAAAFIDAAAAAHAARGLGGGA